MFNANTQQLVVTRPLTAALLSSATSFEDIMVDDNGLFNVHHPIDIFLESLIDSGVGEVFARQSTAPTDLDKVWINTSTSPVTLLVWDGAAWVAANFEDIWPTGSINYAALRARTAKRGTIVVGGRDDLSDGAGGLFSWDSSDNTVNVQNDPMQGVYVAPDTDPTGASGAWVRQYDTLRAIWFGIKPGEVASQLIPSQAAIDFVSLTGGEVIFPSGRIFIGAGTLEITANAVYIRGQGEGYSGGSSIRFPTEFRRLGTSTGPLFSWGGSLSTIVRSGGMTDATIFGNNTSIGTAIEYATHLNFDNVLTDRVSTAWSVRTSSFGNAWTNCTTSNFSIVGWDIRNLCHSTSIINCSTNSLSSASAIADVRIGIDALCSEILILGCSFDHWGVTRQVYAYDARAVNIKSTYFEPKDTALLFSVDLGINGPIRGVSITGSRFLGNNEGGTPVRALNVRGFDFSGNETVNYTSGNAVLNTGADNTGLLGANDWQNLNPIQYATSAPGMSLIDGESLALFGSTTRVGQQTITGSRGANAALEDLLTKLAATGLIDDQTVA